MDMANYWRYFRLDGDPRPNMGPHLFTVCIHHGGRFYSRNGVDKVYRGGEVVYVDGVVIDKVSVAGFDYWANDLGYKSGPISYWFRIPGNEEGTGYLPIVTQADCVDMVQFIPTVQRMLHVFIVCLAGRHQFEEWELDNYDDEVDHTAFFRHNIDDLLLEENTPEEDLLAFMAVEINTSVPQLNVEANRLAAEGFGSVVGGEGPRSASAQCEQRNKSKGKEIVVVEESPEPVRKRGRPKTNLQRRYPTRSNGEGCSNPVIYEDSDDSTDSDDPDFEGIVDSDYDLHSDDEIDFQTHVDGNPSNVEEFGEMGFMGDISDDEGGASDGLSSLHGSSDESGEDVGLFHVKGKKRFSRWKEFNQFTDMKVPKFELGMMFPNSVLFKKAMRKHAVLTRKELRFKRNTKQKVKVICKTSKGCPFTVYASTPEKGNPNMQIKTFKPEHKCSSVKGKVYHCHAGFIADEYADFFMNDPNWSREGVQNAVGRDFDMNVGYQMAYRAKKRAQKLIQGSHEDQYNLLESYAHELKKKNPGSSVWIQTELDGEVRRFKRIYICLEPLKIGWKEGCRPIIGLDGCHLKGVHKGQMLSAVGIDGNNGIYPIAWAIVEAECRDSWTWFLELLRVDLDIHQSVHYAFMSDKQKGLELAIKDLFPFSEHRHCVRHLHNNFKTDKFTGLELKQKLWAIARATTMNQYEYAMEEMKKESPLGWQWCKDRPAIHWSRSHFKVHTKCDILLNNHSESFNKTAVPARKKPILACLEEIRASAMVRLANRRNSGPNWRCRVGPRVEKLLKKNAVWACEYRPLESSPMRFELQGLGILCQSGVTAQHSVQLDKKSCTCRRWDVNGLPCGHAIAAIYSKGWSPDQFVDEYYTIEKYMKAYDPVINPIAGVSEWEIIDRPIAPPLYRAQPGRPKINRTKEPGELPPPTGTQKLPKSFYSQITCGRCKKKGHNVRTCVRRSQAENAEEPQDENAEEHQVVEQNIHVILQQPPDNSETFTDNLVIDVQRWMAMQSQTATNSVPHTEPNPQPESSDTGANEST